VEAHRVVTRRGSHILQTVGSQMVVRVSLYAPAALYPQEDSRYISVRGCVDPRAIVRLEGFGRLKNPMTSSGLKHATFRLVA
jgi:hypothetical protein